MAKIIHGHEYVLYTDRTAEIHGKYVESMAKVREKYGQEAERYKHDKEEIQAEARKLEHEVSVERMRADRFDLAEVFLEIGLVITSITLLSGRRLFWYLGMMFGVVGIVVAITGALIRL